MPTRKVGLLSMVILNSLSRKCTGCEGVQSRLDERNAFGSKLAAYLLFMDMQSKGAVSTLGRVRRRHGRESGQAGESRPVR